MCVLDGVGEPFAGAEVGGGLDIGREPVAGGVDLDGQRRPAGQVAQRGAEPGVELGGS